METTFMSKARRLADENVAPADCRSRRGCIVARRDAAEDAEWTGTCLAPTPRRPGTPPDAAQGHAVMDTDALVTRIKSEFNESPGMCLTLRQGARLWGIAPEDCAKLVERLVAEQFLRWTRNGELVRSESGDYRSRTDLGLGV